MTNDEGVTASQYIAGLSRLMDKPARIPALYEVHERMSPEVFWQVFSHVWTYNETCFMHLHAITEMITIERVLSPARLRVMDSTERFTYDQFANRKGGMVKVYRGAARHGTADNLRGFSWTISRDKAVWFAKRYGVENPVLLAGKVKARDILFFTNSRGEQEVFVMPGRVYVEDFTELPKQTPTFADIVGRNVQIYGVVAPTSTPYAEELQRLRNLCLLGAASAEHISQQAFTDRITSCRELGFLKRAEELTRMHEEFLASPLLPLSDHRAEPV